jgi:hypothetical protein
MVLRGSGFFGYTKDLLFGGLSMESHRRLSMERLSMELHEKKAEYYLTAHAMILGTLNIY